MPYIPAPNQGESIRPFEILTESSEEVTVRTGFEAVLRKKFDQAMPAFLRFETASIERMRAFRFDDHWDDQINGVGDGFTRTLDPFSAASATGTRCSGAPLPGRQTNARDHPQY